MMMRRRRGEPQLVPITVDHLVEEERLTSDRPFLICFQLFLTIWLDKADKNDLYFSEFSLKVERRRTT